MAWEVQVGYQKNNLPKEGGAALTSQQRGGGSPSMAVFEAWIDEAMAKLI